MATHGTHWLGMHKLAKRAKHTTTTSSGTSPAATSTRSATNPIENVATSTSSSSSFAPGVAYTSAITRSVATTPPSAGKDPNTVSVTYTGVSFAGVNSGGTPASAALTAAAQQSSSESSSAVAASSSSNAKPVLTQTDIWGIVGGGAGLAVLLLAMLCWWCWRKRRTRRQEEQWWKLDSSLQGGKPAVGKPVHVEDDWASKDRAFVPEKDWSGSFTPTPTPLSSKPLVERFDNHPFAHSPDRPFASLRDNSFEKEKQHQLMRDQLLGRAPLNGIRKAESVNDVITFGGGPSSQFAPSQYGDSPRQPARNARSHTSYASTALNSSTSYMLGNEDQSPRPPPRALVSPVSPPPPFEMRDTPPMRPPRPSEIRTQSPFADPAPRYEPSRSANATVDAVWKDKGPLSPQDMKVPTQPKSIVPPKRGASTRQALYPPSTLRSPPLPASSTDLVNSFPAPPLSPPPPTSRAESTTTSVNYGRVDSKPLRELEDILDSFKQQVRQSEGPPPIPETEESLRNSTISSFSRDTGAAQHKLELARTTSESSSGMATSSSSSSLSPYPASGSFAMGSYEVSHHPLSIYSSRGDIGELPASPAESPTKAFSRAQAQAARSRGPSPPTRKHDSPTIPLTPLIVRSDSTGREHQAAFFDSPRHSGFDSTTSSFLSDEQVPSTPETTHVVRKVSLKRSEAPPVRMAPSESLRRGPTAAERERDIISQMGLESPTLSSFGDTQSSPMSASTGSPPHTPQDPVFGSPSPIGKRLQMTEAEYEDTLANKGFVPMSSLAVDAHAQSYRSATESIYGMYKNDPHLSRHLSSHVGGLSLR